MEFTGKTVNETIAEGLKEMNLVEEDAIITVIEQPTKGLFGKLKGKAVVLIEKKPIEHDKNVEFLNSILKYLDIKADVCCSQENEKEIFTISTEDSASLIGYRGEVLDAIQTLVGAYVNIGNKVYKKVVVDSENYRDRREETLIKLAHKLEEKATEMRREVFLEPMNPFERRIIHTALVESAMVTTRSEGKEPNRFIIISPNDLDEYSKPYNAGKNNSQRRGDFKKNDSRNGTRNNRKGGFNKKTSDRKNGGVAEIKRKTPSGFGTYLGNSLKDK